MNGRYNRNTATPTRCSVGQQVIPMSKRVWFSFSGWLLRRVQWRSPLKIKKCGWCPVPGGDRQLVGEFEKLAENLVQEIFFAELSTKAHVLEVPEQLIGSNVISFPFRLHHYTYETDKYNLVRPLTQLFFDLSPFRPGLDSPTYPLLFEGRSAFADRLKTLRSLDRVQVNSLIESGINAKYASHVLLLYIDRFLITASTAVVQLNVASFSLASGWRSDLGRWTRYICGVGFDENAGHVTSMLEAARGNESETKRVLADSVTELMAKICTAAARDAAARTIE